MELIRGSQVRRETWIAATSAALHGWTEDCEILAIKPVGLRREIDGMIRNVINARLETVLAPVLVTLERIEADLAEIARIS